MDRRELRNWLSIIVGLFTPLPQCWRNNVASSNQLKYKPILYRPELIFNAAMLGVLVLDGTPFL
jgi:hypothetical protein